MKKGNSKLVLIISILAVVIALGGLAFFAIKNNWFNSAEKNAQQSVVIDDKGNVGIKNLIMLQNNSFDPQTLDAKFGELVYFSKQQQGPSKGL